MQWKSKNKSVLQQGGEKLLTTLSHWKQQTIKTNYLGKQTEIELKNELNSLTVCRNQENGKKCNIFTGKVGPKHPWAGNGIEFSRGIKDWSQGWLNLAFSTIAYKNKDMLKE